MQAEDSVTITACKAFVSNLVPLRTRLVKDFVSPSAAHYPFRRHDLFIETFEAPSSVCCNVSGNIFSLFQHDLLSVQTWPVVCGQSRSFHSARRTASTVVFFPLPPSLHVYRHLDFTLDRATLIYVTGRPSGVHFQPAQGSLSSPRNMGLRDLERRSGFLCPPNKLPTSICSPFMCDDSA